MIADRRRGEHLRRRHAYGVGQCDHVVDADAGVVGGPGGPRGIDQGKALFGGARPAGSDVVLVLTSKNIEADGAEQVVGMADCIGGVAFAENAFAVSEVQAEDAVPFGPVTLFSDLWAKVAAHEIGHLLGAHHHYANCVEGNTDIATGDGSPCTLMINDVGLASLGFSTLNGTVVRGHAEVYAAP